MAEIFRAADVLRDVNLAEYAQKGAGYALRPQDGGRGIAVLENPALGDRVAVARAPDGRRMFAGVRDYAPRGEGESAEQAFGRLCACIARSATNGASIVEFAEHAGRLEREQTAERAAPAALDRRVHGIAPAASPAPVTPEQVAPRPDERLPRRRYGAGLLRREPLALVLVPRTSVMLFASRGHLRMPLGLGTGCSHRHRR
jgi:hypothetical protein